MLQLLQQHNTVFSLSGNLAAAVLYTRDLLYGGRDNSTHVLRGWGVSFLTMEVYTDVFGSSQLVGKFLSIAYCASLGGKNGFHRSILFWVPERYNVGKLSGRFRKAKIDTIIQCRS